MSRSLVLRLSILLLAITMLPAFGQRRPQIETESPLPDGRVGAPYFTALTVRGGEAPYSWQVTSGELPDGLVLVRFIGTITGVPRTPGEYNFTIRVTDDEEETDSRAFTITIDSGQPPSIQTNSLASGTVGVAYSATLSATEGRPPYTWSIAGGALPTGISLNTSSGALEGTPTSAGAFDFTARVTDSRSQSATKALRITINPAPRPPLSITTSTLAAGTVGQSYNQSLVAAGGTPPLTWNVAGGSLPAGLSMSSAGAITGTPTAAGNFDFTARVSDSANQSATKPLRITVNPAPPPPLNITTASLPAGTAGQAYNQNLAATGGAPPYTWSLSGGALPPGVALSGSAITGTPTTAGNFDFTVRVVDTANQSATKQLRITINAAPPPPLNITTASLPAGTAGQSYNQSLAAAGGTPPYTWSLSGGALPPGVTLSGSAITGTPTTAGNYDFTVRVVDTANQSATKPLRITINAAPAPPLSITTASLPAGTTGQAYSQNLIATGGTAPITWSVSAGALPSGLGLSSAGAITGTPSAAGAFDFTARVTDSASQSATRQLRITIGAAPTAPSITTAALPAAMVGVEFTHTFAATGGRSPYTWALTSGNLPAGLTLEAASGRLFGTPTSAGTFPFSLRVTDAETRTGERAFTVTVAAAITITACPLATGIAGTNYSATLVATGGAAPYLWSVVSGQLPPGVTLATSTGVLSGNPLLGGSFNFTLNVSDAGARSATRACLITISSPLRVLTETLSDATTRAAYTQTLLATGGSAPYSWATVAGSLPPGLALSESLGTIAGQPSQPGRFTFTVQVNDTAGAQAQRSLTISVAAGLAISACPNPTAMVSQAYASTLTSIGGQSPYVWSVPAGSLPAGLTLIADSGVLSGTPTAPGTAEFSIQVVDSSSTSASRTCSIQVVPELTIRTASLPGTEVGAAYSASLEVSGGFAPYNWTISAGALAPGMTMNSATGQITGTASAAAPFRFTARVTDSAGVQREKQLEIVVGAGFAITACPAPSATVGEAYSSSLPTSGGEAPMTWTLASGSLPDGLVLGAQTGTVTGAATTIGTSEFAIGASDTAARTATRACSIVVIASAIRVSAPETLPDGIVGTAYQQTLQASGGHAPYIWSISEGTLPDGVTVSPDGNIAGSPVSTGTFSFTIRVADADGGAATRAFALRILPAAAPGISFVDLPDIVPPAQQPRFRMTLDKAYPASLRGRLTLRFLPDPRANIDDPSVRFVTGARTIDFEVPPDTIEPVFPVPQVALQTGSVAGTIELSVTLAAGELDVTPSPAPVKTVQIDRTAPVVTNVRVNSVANGFELLITGFSTTREVTSATFQFTPAAGSRLAASQVTVQTEDAALQWFSDSRSAGFGGQFTFVQPFTIQNATLSEVSVTLTNGQGTSQAARAPF